MINLGLFHVVLFSSFALFVFHYGLFLIEISLASVKFAVSITHSPANQHSIGRCLSLLKIKGSNDVHCTGKRIPVLRQQLELKLAKECQPWPSAK